jgi:hypothetical protein
MPVFVAQMELPGWLLFVIALILGIPSVRAFPFQPPVPTTVSTSHYFPSLPLVAGLRNIHTLEHLETIPHDFFRIRHVGQPVRYGEFVTVSVECLVRNQTHTIFMLANPDQPSTCTFMCLRDNIQRAAFTVRATRLSREGHTLLLNSTYFSSKRLFDRELIPVRCFLAFFEDKTRRLPDSLAMKPHPNLQWYRRMVLGLPAGEPDIRGL